MDTIRIAAVDDSVFVRKALVRILGAASGIEVVGTAASGEELLEHLEEWRPDLISLDLSMPGMGGLATLDEIMTRRPTPVIVLSTLARESAPMTVEALHRGAVDFIDKQQFSMVDFSRISQVLVEKIQQLARLATSSESTPTPTRIPSPTREASQPLAPGPPRPALRRLRGGQEVLLIGASTGGPLAIQTVLEALPDDFAPPVVIVQHMPAGFTSAFARRLDARLPLAVREARAGDELATRTALLAPGGQHLTLETREGELIVALSRRDDASPHCPSVDRLFLSAAAVAGDRTVAILLTGMGSDGAEGMVALAKAGAYTLAQDEASSVVFGMPRAAIEKHAVKEVLPLERIGPRLHELTVADTR